MPNLRSPRSASPESFSRTRWYLAVVGPGIRGSLGCLAVRPTELEPSEAAYAHVLPRRRGERRHQLADRLRRVADVRLREELVDVLRVHRRDLHRDLASELAEFVVARHEVGLARELHKRADPAAAVDVRLDDAFPGLAALHLLADQLHGADRVVVRRNDHVDEIGIAVGVDHGRDRYLKSTRLVDRDVLAVRIDDEECRRRALELSDAGEVTIQVGELILEALRVLLRHRREVASLLPLVQVVETLDPLLDRHEVRKESTEPALVNVVHAAALGLLRDRLLRLLLRPDEQDLAAVRGEVAHDAVRLLDAGEGLLEIDDVDAVALDKDELLHLGVPAARLVPEVNPGLQELFHCHDCHAFLPYFLRLFVAPPGAAARRGSVGAMEKRRASYRARARSEVIVPPRGRTPTLARPVRGTSRRWPNTTKRRSRAAPPAAGRSSCPTTS